MGKGIIVGANENMNEPVVADPVLNNNSWETISKMSNSNKAKDIWAVGDAKQITLNGSVGSLGLSNYQLYVYILGFNHNADLEGQNTMHFGFGKTALSGGTNIALVDGQYDTTGSSTAFRMNTSNTNVGGWKSSYMRQTIINANATSPTSGSTNSFLAALPSDLQAVLKQCTKYTDNVGNGTGNIQSNVTPTQDWIFLLSEFEVQGSISQANTYEAQYQKQYQYYINGNSKIKYTQHLNVTCDWFLRSPYNLLSTYYCATLTRGNSNRRSAYASFGFAPAFCV